MMQYGFSLLMSSIASRRYLARLKSHRFPSALTEVKSRENPGLRPMSFAMLQILGGLYTSATSTWHPSLSLITCICPSLDSESNASMAILSSSPACSGVALDCAVVGSGIVCHELDATLCCVINWSVFGTIGAGNAIDALLSSINRGDF